MTAKEEEEEADAVRRSNRQRRPPVHLSEDDYPGSDAEPASDDDRAARMARKLHVFPGAPHWLGALSDDSDQSCYGEFLAVPSQGMLTCSVFYLAWYLSIWCVVCAAVVLTGAEVLLSKVYPASVNYMLQI